MRYVIIAIGIMSNLWVYAQPRNVLISTSNRPNEPSICINPNNVDQLVGGSNLANVYTSDDGGETWSESVMSSSFGVWGDPVIICDTAGDFYFFHLSNPPGGSWIDRIVCQKSIDAGKTWTNGRHMGLNGTKAQDKEWGVVDRTNNNIHVTWTQFDSYGSRDTADYSNIMYSKSVDNGLNWSIAQQINDVSGDCIDSSLTTEGAVPAVGPNGEIYVSWSGPAGLVFDRSLDGGRTWGKDVQIDSYPGWTYDIPGLNRSNGLPITMCDLSNGPNRGTIYVNWSDQRKGTDDTEVWLSKSTDGGATWTSPKRVNDDTTKTHQFLTWMTIDQTTGYLYFTWYDRRNYTDTKTETYMAVSYDGGETFQNMKLSERYFEPNPTVFFGDYTNVTAAQGRVRPIWTEMHNSSTQIWTAIYEEQNVGDFNIDRPKTSLKIFPNPFTDTMTVEFDLNQSGKVSLMIYDLGGKRVAKVLKNKKYDPGKVSVQIDANELKLTPGAYVVSISGPELEMRRQVILKN